MGTDSTPLVTSAREEPPADELLILWQEEPATAASLGDEALRAHAARVARAHRFLRLLRTVQHVGTAFGIVAATAVALRFTDPLMRVGAALLALSFVFRWTILRRTAPTAEATSAGPMVSSEPSLAAYHAVSAGAPAWIPAWAEPTSASSSSSARCAVKIAASASLLRRAT